jgi:hypothetical protein
MFFLCVRQKVLTGSGPNSFIGPRVSTFPLPGAWRLLWCGLWTKPAAQPTLKREKIGARWRARPKKRAEIAAALVHQTHEACGALTDYSYSIECRPNMLPSVSVASAICPY